jgi:hypothetical protein
VNPSIRLGRTGGGGTSSRSIRDVVVGSIGSRPGNSLAIGAFEIGSAVGMSCFIGVLLVGVAGSLSNPPTGRISVTGGALGCFPVSRATSPDFLSPTAGVAAFACGLLETNLPGRVLHWVH